MALFLGFLVSCAPADAPLHADKLTFWVGGAYSITLLPDGSGSTATDEPGKTATEKRFRIGHQKFLEVLAHLDSYRPLAVSERELFSKPTCASGHRITDMGGITVEWMDSGSSSFYYADLGCDPEIHQARNDDLRQVINDLAASARPPINR